MGFSHVGINVPADKFEETLNFYLTCLKPLGYREVMRPVPEAVGLGAGFVPEFWVCTKPGASDNQQVHIAFCSNNRELVKTFHTKGLEAGGKCNGPPGLRPEYTRMYYAAFVHDPVGNNVEVMCMWPAWTHWKYWFGLGVFGEKDKSL